MQLRTGTPTDAAAIAALIASLQPLLTDHPDGTGAEAFLASVNEEAQARYLASSRYDYLLAHEGDTLVGFVALRDRTHVFHLFVRREHHQQGIAKALWREAMRRTEVDHPDPDYTVNASLVAVPVYEAFGFRAAGPVARVHGISFLPMRRLRRDDAAQEHPRPHPPSP